MSKSISIGFGIFALLLTALLVVPLFIDLNQWKPQIESMASQSLGREVRVDGNIEISILPFPGIALYSVHIANGKGFSAKEMLKVDEVTATVSLLPLLTKTLEFSQIRLTNPDVHLETNKAGQSNWDFMKGLKIDSDGQNLSIGGWTVIPTLPRVNILQGSLYYNDVGAHYEISEFQLYLKSNSVNGPYSLKGHMILNKQEVEFETKVGEINNKQPVGLDTQLFVQGQRLQVVGNYLQDQKSFKGQIASKFNPAELVGDISPVKGDIVLAADIAGQGKTVNVTNLSIGHGDQKVSGGIKLDFGAVALYEATLVNLPGKTNLTFSGPLTKLTKLQGQVELVSTDFEQFVQWLNLAGTIPIQGKSITFSSNYDLGDGGWKFSFMKLAIDKKDLSGSVDVRLPDATINLSTEDLSEWMALWDGLKPVGGIAKANLTGNIRVDQEISIDTRLSFLKGYVYSKGKFSPQLDSYDLALQLLHPNVNDLFSIVSYGFAKPQLGALNGQVHLKGDKQKISFSHLNATLSPPGQNIQFSGQGSVSFKGEKPYVKANVNIGKVDVAQLWAQLNASDVPKIMLASTRSTGDKQKKEEDPDTPLNLGFLNDFDGEVHLKTDQLVLSGLKLEKLDIPIIVKAGEARITELTGGSLGTKIEGSATVSAGETTQLDLDVKLKNAHLESLKGKLDADLNLMAEGTTVNDLLAHTKGDVDITARDVSISGFDADKFVSRVNAVKASSTSLGKGLINQLRENAGGLLKGGSKGTVGGLTSLNVTDFNGSTKLDTIIGKGVISKGIVNLATIQVSSAQLSGNGTGSISFVDRTMDINLSLVFTRLKAAPAIGIGLQGSIYDPKRSFKVEEFTKYLVARAGASIAGGASKGDSGPLGAGKILSILGD